MLIGITMDSGFDVEENVETFIKKHDQAYPILWDDKKTSRAYKVIKIPTTYISDRHHNVVEKLVGFLPVIFKKTR